MRRVAFLSFTLLLLNGGALRAQQKSVPPPAPAGETPVTTPTPSAPANPVPMQAPAVATRPNGKIQKSLVRITATEVEPDYRAPWNSGGIQRGVGAGFVIDGNRIMTNAHVVSNSRYLTVERDGDPNKYPATVLFVAHDCDLALLEVEDATFLSSMEPLELGELPKVRSTVTTYGYPAGGEQISYTRGVVSRDGFDREGLPSVVRTRHRRGQRHGCGAQENHPRTAGPRRYALQQHPPRRWPAHGRPTRTNGLLSDRAH